MENRNEKKLKNCIVSEKLMELKNEKIVNNANFNETVDTNLEELCYDDSFENNEAAGNVNLVDAEI